MFIGKPLLITGGACTFGKAVLSRLRFWGVVPELEGRILRVITLEDKQTIHNAFPDRRFKQ